MFKRTLDIAVSLVGLIVLSPVLLVLMFLVWRQDGHHPLYLGQRVGKDERLFKMAKLRSMVVNAAASGVDSTAANDKRITKVGHFIRRYKLDEFTQLWNVLIGDMSLVGPRPNVKRETDLYTPVEKKLLTVRPGITDFASIVFSDEGEILRDKDDPDIAYNQLIRPYKNRLGLLYIEHAGVILDIKLTTLTIVAILSRRLALAGVQSILRKVGAAPDLMRVALRMDELLPAPPPGATRIVTTRDEVST